MLLAVNLILSCLLMLMTPMLRAAESSAAAQTKLDHVATAKAREVAFVVTNRTSDDIKFIIEEDCNQLSRGYANNNDQLDFSIVHAAQRIQEDTYMVAPGKYSVPVKFSKKSSPQVACMYWSQGVSSTWCKFDFGANMSKVGFIVRAGSQGALEIEAEGGHLSCD